MLKSMTENWQKYYFYKRKKSLGNSLMFGLLVVSYTREQDQPFDLKLCNNQYHESQDSICCFG